MINYFHKLFKAFTGKTPHDYLSDVRLTHAKHLLAFTQKSIEALNKISDVDPSIEGMIAKLKSFKSELEDIAETTKDLCGVDSLENPDLELDKIEENGESMDSMLSAFYAKFLKELAQCAEPAPDK